MTCDNRTSCVGVKYWCVTTFYINISLCCVQERRCSIVYPLVGDPSPPKDANEALIQVVKAMICGFVELAARFGIFFFIWPLTNCNSNLVVVIIACLFSTLYLTPSCCDRTKTFEKCWMLRGLFLMTMLSTSHLFGSRCEVVNVFSKLLFIGGCFFCNIENKNSILSVFVTCVVIPCTTTTIICNSTSNNNCSCCCCCCFLKVMHEIRNPSQYFGTPLSSFPRFTKIIKGVCTPEVVFVGWRCSGVDVCSVQPPLISSSISVFMICWIELNWIEPQGYAVVSCPCLLDQQGLVKQHY